MKKITLDCPHCQVAQTLALEEIQTTGFSYPCGACNQTIQLTRLTSELTACPVCGCKDLYQHKDFNKKIGIALFIVGAILAPWTYYASLFVALIIDALLYPFFGWVIVCYRCFAEMRGWDKQSTLDRFNHEIGAHYEYRQEAQTERKD